MHLEPPSGAGLLLIVCTVLVVVFLFVAHRRNLKQKVPLFYCWLGAIAVLGGAAAFFLPIAVNSGFAKDDDGSALRQALLYTTGGLLGVITLGETHRKNNQEKEKNENDHTRQVYAERRSRYTKAVEQLANEKAAVRLGGIYTLVGLVDEWLTDDTLNHKERQKEGQVIINNLCSYIRSPFPLAEKIDEYNAYKKLEELKKKESENLLNEVEQFELKALVKRFTNSQDYKESEDITADYAKFHEEQDVRRTIFIEMGKRSSVISNKEGSDVTVISGAWSDFDFDFSRAPIFYPLSSLTIEKGNFSGAKFYAGTDFFKATFNNEAQFGKATFTSNVNFVETIFNSNAYFGETTFNNLAHFGEATFNNEAHFGKVTFNNIAVFRETTFNNIAHFGEATFNNLAHFGKATFNNIAVFRETTFNYLAGFGKTTFNDIAYFGKATFNNEAYFGEATFNNIAGFVETTFNNNAHFVEATFNNIALFSETTFNNISGFVETTFNNEAHFNKANFNNESYFGEATFNNIAGFVETTFNNIAHFGEATFNNIAHFGKATFIQTADFWQVTFTGNVDFGSAEFSEKADFGGAEFSGDADFNDSFFKKYAPIFAYDSGSARFSDQVNWTESNFSVRSESKPIELGSATLGDKTFSIPFGTVVFDPDSWDEKTKEYTHMSVTCCRIQRSPHHQE